MQQLFLGLAASMLFALCAFSQGDLSKSERTRRAEAYGRTVSEVAATVARNTGESPAEYLLSGIEALYADQRTPIPAELRQRLERLRPGDSDRTAEFALANLGDLPGLTFGRAVVVTVNGFRSKTDPTSGLVFQDMLISSPNGLRIGVELEGLTLFDRIVYHVDRLNLAGINRADFVKPPIGPIWKISRVVPGSPAAEAGIVPGDRIVDVERTKLDHDSNAKLFAAVTAAEEQAVMDEFGNRKARGSIRLAYERVETQTQVNAVVSFPYQAKVFHAPNRSKLGEPDWWLDREAGIACIRVGAIENGSETEFVDILENLRLQGIKGLLLDLRWCPGGYVLPTTTLLSQFLPVGTPISKLEPLTVSPIMMTPRPEIAGGGYHPDWLTIPMAVLVNTETTGGGEMIAAALQDHKSAVVLGQRTFGKANIMSAYPIQLPGLAYRATTGYSLRPSGGMRHRFPTSKREDPWGVKPDRGWEIPTTAEQSQLLFRQAERLAIRRSTDRGILPADDPAEDAQRLTALKLFRKRLTELQLPRTP